MDNLLTIAISNVSVYDETARFLEQIPGVKIVRLENANVGPAAIAGLADLAVVNPRTIVAAEGLYDVYPYFCISSWGDAGVNLHLPGGLENPPQKISAEPELAEFVDIARIILKENYGMSVAVDEEMSDSLNTAMITRQSERSGLTLDLAQEWSEAENYPLVLGLLVSRMDERPAQLSTLLEAIRDLLAGNVADGVVDVEVLPRVRFGYDDLVTASLTALAEHLFYHNVTDEIMTIRPVEISHLER